MAVDPLQLAFAMVLAGILICIVIAIANYISYFGREQAMKRAASQPWNLDDIIVPPKHFILLRILLDKNNHASLSAFQFMMWTLLISFLYVSLWFLLLLTGSTAHPDAIPIELMALMGISVAIPITSQGISSYKRSKTRKEGESYTEPNYASMLEENGRPSLLRVQMFLWTLVALAIYTWLFFVQIFSPDTTTLGLPTIDPTLLFLMGLSATGYLGNQAYSGRVTKTDVPTSSPPQVKSTSSTTPIQGPIALRDIIPRDIEPKGIVTLLGAGFGTQADTIMIDEDRVLPALIRRWEDSRIEFTMPETASQGSHTLRIISGGDTVNGQVRVSGPLWTRGLDEIDATIIGDIWIDDPYQKGYKIPPIGYFIPDKRYYFFFEFEVPPGTPQWGKTQFRAKFFLNGVLIGSRSFMPGTMNGKNYGNFDYVFPEEGKHHIQITGVNTKTMDIEVKKPLIQ